MGGCQILNRIFRVGHTEKVTLSKGLKELRDKSYQSGGSNLAAVRTVKVLRQKYSWLFKESVLGALPTISTSEIIEQGWKTSNNACVLFFTALPQMLPYAFSVPFSLPFCWIGLDLANPLSLLPSWKPRSMVSSFRIFLIPIFIIAPREI